MNPQARGFRAENDGGKRGSKLCELDLDGLADEVRCVHWADDKIEETSWEAKAKPLLELNYDKLINLLSQEGLGII